MKISVQMLIFQSESTLPKGMMQACVAQFYDHVDQIIFVEGATKAMTHKFDGDASSFTKSGASTDGTIEALFKLPDPDKKIEVVLNKGWWDGKTQMANEAAKRATGDYLWEISSDEFYKTDDIFVIKRILENDRPDAVHFFANHFVGDFHHVIDEETGHLWGNDIPWARIHRNEVGSRWYTHEPPLYQLSSGLFCDNGKLVTREQTRDMGVWLCHYGYISARQALFKSKFYKRPEYVMMWHNFQKDKDTLWINGAKAREYTGSHPEAINKLLV